MTTWIGIIDQLDKCRIFSETKTEVPNYNDIQSRFSESISRHDRFGIVVEKGIHWIGHQRLLFGDVWRTDFEMSCDSTSGHVGIVVGVLTDPSTVLANNMRCSMVDMDHFIDFFPKFA